MSPICTPLCITSLGATSSLPTSITCLSTSCNIHQFSCTHACPIGPSFYQLEHQLCAHHLFSHQPMSTFAGHAICVICLATSVDFYSTCTALCQFPSTLCLPNAFGPPSSTLHLFPA